MKKMQERLDELLIQKQNVENRMSQEEAYVKQPTATFGNMSPAGEEITPKFSASAHLLYQRNQ